MRESFILFTLILSINCFAQLEKYKCISIYQIEKTEKIEKKSELKKVDSQIIFNTTTNIISFIGNDLGNFSIVKKISYDSNEENRTHFNCLSGKKEKTTIKIIYLKKEKKTQIIVQYSNLIYVYEAIKLD